MAGIPVVPDAGIPSERDDGGVVDLSFATFFGLPEATAPTLGFATRHTSLTVWTRRNRDPHWKLERYNDAAHLVG